jgi:hypothetical protein
MNHAQNNNISITVLKERIGRMCGQTGLPQTFRREIVMTKESHRRRTKQSPTLA